MSKYSDNFEWCLTDGYNTRRGEILDGSRVSTTPSVTWRIGKHCVDDDSIHYTFIKFLNNQSLKKASFRKLRELNPNADEFLRELEKQKICALV